jgi:putative oxidoreductase
MMEYMNSRVVMQWGPLVARVLLGTVFIIAGVGKIAGFTMTAGYIASVGLPMPALLTMLTIIVEVGAGLMLVTGIMGRIAAKVLFIFTLLATIFFHNNLGDQLQMMMALKNLSMMGGLLMVFIHGTGPMSVGCWCKKCEKDGKCHYCEDAKCTGENHGQ